MNDLLIITGAAVWMAVAGFVVLLICYLVRDIFRAVRFARIIRSAQREIGLRPKGRFWRLVWWCCDATYVTVQNGDIARDVHNPYRR